jgi:SAM-dependent methyltransferase
MASSFPNQIPGIIYLVSQLNPKAVLDIGKGFGKYGFLLHEYVGVNNKRRIEPTKTLREQSQIKIDALEVDEDLMLPHLSHLYDKIEFGDVAKIYKTLGSYDLVLMIDIIEHISKEAGLAIVKHFLSKGAKLIIATPKDFFEQNLYDSTYENHISHWTLNDFKSIAFVEYQYFGAGAVYFLSNEKMTIRGFGNSFLQKLRRLGSALKSEI